MRTHTACIQIEYTHKEWGEEGEGWVWGGGRERDSVRAIERERESARARDRETVAWWGCCIMPRRSW